jgi:Na+/melibiose symporter-like transporter
MNLTSTQTNQRQTNQFLEVFRNRNFRLLWIGEAISVFGDHFYIVALPWLVLQITGDALAMGAVLALPLSRALCSCSSAARCLTVSRRATSCSPPTLHGLF